MRRSVSTELITVSVIQIDRVARQVRCQAIVSIFLTFAYRLALDLGA